MNEEKKIVTEESAVVPEPLHLTNEEIRESGVMEDIIKAMDHEVDPVGVYEAIEHSVVSTYKKIEDSVVGAYQKIEESVVGAFEKVEDHFVDKFFRKEDETVEQAKDRLSKK